MKLHEVNELCISYGGINAVIDLEVKQGEMVALIGTSCSRACASTAGRSGHAVRRRAADARHWPCVDERPKLLLLDEPMGLAPLTLQRIWGGVGWSNCASLKRIKGEM